MSRTPVRIKFARYDPHGDFWNHGCATCAAGEWRLSIPEA